jgi:NTP pyrophosphatase (non-canonical NTP hydrolase)
MSFEITELEVVRWAEARGIIRNSDSKTQLLKAVSEMGELADAVIKRDRDAIIDGIGDVLVCLIVAATIEDVDVKQCLRAAYEEIKDRKGYLNRDGVFIKEERNLG